MEFQILILLALIAVLGSVTAGFMLTAERLGIWDWYSIQRKTWMPLLCVFCLSFWLSVIMLTVLFLCGFPFHHLYLFSTLASAAVSRIMISDKSHYDRD